MAQLPQAALPFVDPKTGKINPEWHAALVRIAASTLPYKVFSGTGAPSMRAPKGSIYLRDDGSTTNDRVYINTNGATGWTAMITAS